MKNKILATLVAFGLVGSVSAVEINENLSINGFLDFSYLNKETSGAVNDVQELEMDEVEIDFLFNVGNVSGEVHVDNDGSGDSSFDIEQAHFTFALDSGVAFTVGKFGSKLGFEREDPAGLFTYSRAYGDLSVGGARSNSYNLGNVDQNHYHGISTGYDNGAFSIAASLVNPTNATDAVDTNNLDLELAIAYTGFENVSIGGGYYFNNEVDNSDEEDILNVFVSTEFGKLFLAAEYIEVQTENALIGDLDGYMLLADYDFNDKLGVAFRISSNETETANEDYDKVTIAPNYSFTDSLGAIIEYSDIDQGTTDVNLLAVELTYTF